MDEELDSNGTPRNTWLEGFPTYIIEYADDTFLMSRTTGQMQTILSSLESVASEYGMALTKTKTELLIPAQSIDHTLQFHDGSKVPTKDTIKYLDSMVSWTKPVETAFYHRAGLADKAYKKLRLTWTRKKQEFHIFPYDLCPALIYGLEALTPTTPHMKGINAYYIRFLRRLVACL